MSEYKATIHWKCASPEFLSGRYSREHTWSFDGGFTMPASSSPSVVRVPYSNPGHVDPEEAFVASIASCHMLTFLHMASRKGFQVDSYTDEAVGVMAKNEAGRSWVSKVTLHPKICYAGEKRPSPAEEEGLHHQAHEQCFISNSIRTTVAIEPISTVG